MGHSHSKPKGSKKGDNNKDKDEGVDQNKIDQAILDLKVTRDNLRIFQKQQERCQETELEKARELAKKGQKERAKMVLRQKKAREYYINNEEKMIAGIEAQINNVETKQIEINMMNNLKQTNDILKHLNDLMPIDEVERIMDENQEQQDRLNEINDTLSQSMDPQMKQFVDEDLDKMYEELETGEPESDKASAGQESGDASAEESEENPAPQKTAMAA